MHQLPGICPIWVILLIGCFNIDIIDVHIQRYHKFFIDIYYCEIWVAIQIGVNCSWDQVDTYSFTLIMDCFACRKIIFVCMTRHCKSHNMLISFHNSSKSMTPCINTFFERRLMINQNCLSAACFQISQLCFQPLQLIARIVMLM